MLAKDQWRPGIAPRVWIDGAVGRYRVPAGLGGAPTPSSLINKWRDFWFGTEKCHINCIPENMGEGYGVVHCYISLMMVLSSWYANAATESPVYMVVLSAPDVEIRLYRESSWITALVVAGTSFNKSTHDGFHRFVLLIFPFSHHTKHPSYYRSTG
ncbi:putative SOUL hem-binding protein [Helianthus anomalus]